MQFPHRKYDSAAKYLDDYAHELAGALTTVDRDAVEQAEAPPPNYGLVEDAHQSLIPILATCLRQTAMPEKLIVERKF